MFCIRSFLYLFLLQVLYWIGQSIEALQINEVHIVAAPCMPCTLQYNTIHTLQSNVPAFHTHYNAISPACHTHYSTTFMHLSIQRNAQPHTLQSNTPAQATPYNTMSLHRPHILQCNTLHSHTHCQVIPLHNAQATQATAATGWF